MKIPVFQIENYIKKIADEKIVGCLIFGPNISLVNYYSALVSKKIVSDLSDPFLVSNISKERFLEDKTVLLDELFSFSMLGGRKLIILKDPDISVAKVLKNLSQEDNLDKEGKNFILIQASDLEKTSALRKFCEESPFFAAIPCYEDTEGAIKKFISEYLKKKKVEFDDQLIEIIYKKFGTNRYLIDAGLKKILSYLNDGERLDVETVELLTLSQTESLISDFVISFVDQNLEQSLSRLERLLNKGFDPLFILRSLTNYMQKIYLAKVEIDFEGISVDEAVKARFLFFKEEAEFRKQINRISLKRIIKILSEIEDLEIKIKNYQTPPLPLFTYFVHKALNFS